MQLEKTSKLFRELFLLEFTREIILNYRTKEMAELEARIREDIRKKLGMQEDEKKFLEIFKKNKFWDFSKKKVVKEETKKEVSNAFYSQPIIEELKKITPQRILPTITQSSQTGIQKIEAFINDPSIFSIECEGPNKNLILRGANGAGIAEITMTKQDINEIINYFSRYSRIPAEEGAYKVAVGNIIFSAIVSEIIEPRFLITKVLS